MCDETVAIICIDTASKRNEKFRHLYCSDFYKTKFPFYKPCVKR